MMDTFLSCDWGTSTFRLRLVNTSPLTVLAEAISPEGIAALFTRWKNEPGTPNERLSFYRSWLGTQIKKLEEKQGMDLQHLPLIVSGMASSSIGMKELPYKELPFKTDGSDLAVNYIPPAAGMTNPLFLLSGACTNNDVLRGEETLLAGAGADTAGEEAVFIFPGTHSKHVYVQNSTAVDFKTFMTGEFFELLTVKSILANSVEKSEWAGAGTFFQEGILAGTSSSLLNSAFHARTNVLFKKCTPAENYQYLSGLLIGHELKDLQTAARQIVLVAGQGLKDQYLQALSILGLAEKTTCIDADAALLKGQWRIWQATHKQFIRDHS
ncbi:2-dehydro-3-deoxygalactonokinase [Pseudoflavitalea sp. X16]|nr:2-dehydro-3-deoxygalactonokinase [Paraflavitalea devenefica]